MKLAIRTLIDSAQALHLIDSSKVSARLSYTLGIVLNAIKPYWEQYDTTNNAILKKLGKPNSEVPGQWNFETTEQAEQYKAEMDELLDTVVDVKIPGRIPLKALIDEGLKLSGNDAAALDWLIKGKVEDGLFEEEKNE